MSVAARSVNNVLIRLPEERWAHIIEEHGELEEMQADVLRVVRRPERVLQGNSGALMATSEVEPGKHLVVVYRELEVDGFVITAFLTRRTRQLKRREQRWPEQKFPLT